MPSTHRPGRGQRIGRHPGQRVAQERAAAVGFRGQPVFLKRLRQVLVDLPRALIEVEPLQARGRRLQAALAVGALAQSPRPAERTGVLRADRRHVPLHVPQRRRVRAQALKLQPPQVIHQQIRVRPVRPARARTQEPVRHPVQRAVRPHDRVLPAAVAPNDLLHPDIAHNQPPSHAPSALLRTSRTGRSRSVRRAS